MERMLETLPQNVVKVLMIISKIGKIISTFIFIIFNIIWPDNQFSIFLSSLTFNNTAAMLTTTKMPEMK